MSKISLTGKRKVYLYFNPVPDDKILTMNKLKEFANDNFNVAQITLYQTKKFRPFQTERVRRRQLKLWWKWKKVLQNGWKHSGKRRNCLRWSFSPFPTVFSNDLYCRHVKKKQWLVWERDNAISVWEWAENIVEKGENAGYQHLSFSHNVFERLFSLVGGQKSFFSW